MKHFFKVNLIPESNQSIDQYLGSYVYPLLEETRAQLYSSMEFLYQAPYAKLVDFKDSKPHGTRLEFIKFKLTNGRIDSMIVARGHTKLCLGISSFKQMLNQKLFPTWIGVADHGPFYPSLKSERMIA
ncbi:hypothetical protein PanWU01x14_304060 [Parasponia andersonii]|uniref:Uncharacterized protein n=1 Tax=Parasponia andersonii TaxID=3476 RepID=A0A2P5ASV8_PARAD|nr:hypothetical protein PanWU01x14_304060 [Parasponia andersonii]